jgi:hypothetical protein
MAVTKAESSWLDIESRRQQMDTQVANAANSNMDKQLEDHAKRERDYIRWWTKSTMAPHPHAKKDPGSEGSS